MERADVEALRRAIARAVIERMGWRSTSVDEVATHVLVEHGSNPAQVEFRWAGGGVVAGVVADEGGDADGYAEAIAADLKHRVGRFGVVLPWR